MNDPYLNTNSIESRFRERRFKLFRSMVEASLSRSENVRILDIGGTEKYWRIADPLLEKYPGRLTILLLNIDAGPALERPHLFREIIGDACDPNILSGERFEFVHSNSVIEHVGDWTRILSFVNNVKRLSDQYYVQTPNYWFPIEPHFRILGFQWLPIRLRTALVQLRRCGFYDRTPDYNEARRIVEDVRLLVEAELRHLFPGARINRETVLGMTKSLMVTGERTKRQSLEAPSLMIDEDLLWDENSTGTADVLAEPTVLRSA